MKRLVYVLLVVLLFASGAMLVANAAIVSQGNDGKMYLMLDEQEVAALHTLMAGKDAEIARLKAERKTECGLI